MEMEKAGVDLSRENHKEDIEKAILNLAKTRNATFEQMQAVANNYDIDLSRTLYCADIEER